MFLIWYTLRPKIGPLYHILKNKRSDRLCCLEYKLVIFCIFKIVLLEGDSIQGDLISPALLLSFICKVLSFPSFLLIFPVPLFLSSAFYFLHFWLNWVLTLLKNVDLLSQILLSGIYIFSIFLTYKISFSIAYLTRYS